MIKIIVAGFAAAAATSVRKKKNRRHRERERDSFEKMGKWGKELRKHIDSTEMRSDTYVNYKIFNSK